jgi:hypothetical protein
MIVSASSKAADRIHYNMLKASFALAQEGEHPLELGAVGSLGAFAFLDEDLGDGKPLMLAKHPTLFLLRFETQILSLLLR